MKQQSMTLTIAYAIVAVLTFGAFGLMCSILASELTSGFVQLFSK